MDNQPMDKYFRVEVLSATPNPQTVIYQALHQDYSEGFVYDDKPPSEQRCGEIAIERLLKGGRGHFGPLEHPQIVLNAGWFPHSTMQQIRTHRHISMDVQSGRYTGKRIIAAAEVVLSDADDDEWMNAIDEVFYFRPIGQYCDRNGKKYEYTEEHRQYHIDKAATAALQYRNDVVSHGLSEEHARSMIPFDIRQHWVLSCNLRTLTHLLTIRGKSDAQLECQQLCELILPHFQVWAPQIYEWFMDKQWNKGRLAP